MRIDVTQQLITLNGRGKKCWCPVALALRAAGLSFVEVTQTQFHFKYKDKHYVMFIPEDVNQKIAAFDEQGTMEPFSFELMVSA